MTGSRGWWESKRANYNLALISAGCFAFLSNVFLVWFVVPPPPSGREGPEVSFFTIFVYWLIYLIAMGVANVCYFLGPVSERLIQPKDPKLFRERVYKLGLAFSVLLPCLSPLSWLWVAVLGW